MPAPETRILTWAKQPQPLAVLIEIMSQTHEQLS
jgi:hypothetical protein